MGTGRSQSQEVKLYAFIPSALLLMEHLSKSFQDGKEVGVCFPGSIGGKVRGGGGQCSKATEPSRHYSLR